MNNDYFATGVMGFIFGFLFSMYIVGGISYGKWSEEAIAKGHARHNEITGKFEWRTVCVPENKTIAEEKQ